VSFADLDMLASAARGPAALLARRQARAPRAREALRVPARSAKGRAGRQHGGAARGRGDDPHARPRAQGGGQEA